MKEDKYLTNADRIRQMDDIELAKFIRAVQCNFRFGADCGYPACPQMEGKGEDLGCNKHYNDAMLDWLKKEVQHG